LSLNFGQRQGTRIIFFKIIATGLQAASVLSASAIEDLFSRKTSLFTLIGFTKKNVVKITWTFLLNRESNLRLTLSLQILYYLCSLLTLPVCSVKAVKIIVSDQWLRKSMNFDKMLFLSRESFFVDKAATTSAAAVPIAATAVATAAADLSAWRMRRANFPRSVDRHAEDGAHIPRCSAAFFV